MMMKGPGMNIIILLSQLNPNSKIEVMVCHDPFSCDMRDAAEILPETQSFLLYTLFAYS